MTVSSGLQSWRISYEINPIIFVGGVAGTPGSNIPISNYLSSSKPSALAGPQGVGVGGGGSIFSNAVDSSQDDIDNYFAHFFVLPGAELIVNQFAHYPFLNQTVAANAIITQPLKLSLRMVAPVKGAQTYYDKLSILTALKSTLDQHINLGGTFNVATPSYIYTGCLLESLKDISSGETEQLQFEWEWVFERPLLTLDQISSVQNALMGKISSNTQLTGDPPSPPVATTVAVPAPNIATALIPSAAASVAAGVSSAIAPIAASSPLQSIILETQSPRP